LINFIYLSQATLLLLSFDKRISIREKVHHLSLAEAREKELTHTALAAILPQQQLDAIRCSSLPII